MAVNIDIRKELPCDAIVFDNFVYDKSIIGITLDDRVVYAYELMVEELMQDENWNEDEAIDWIEYNTLRALQYLGENAPIVISLLRMEA